jgi:hypothetical protein
MSDEVDSVTYQGEVIQLSKTYADFKAYRDDPNNLPQGELPRVARLVKAAVVPARFDTREAADDFVYTLMFPGYGLSLFQLDEPLALFSVEVPQMDEDRWITVAPQGSHWYVIDDFIWPIAKGAIARAEYDGQRLWYRDRHGAVLRET